MKNTTLCVLFLLAMIVVNTSALAQTQITSCNSQFMDLGGDSSNYLNNENSEWLICPNIDTEYLILEFTYVNIEAANNSGIDSTGCYDLLYIYDGLDANAPLLGSYCGEDSGTGKEAFFESHNLKIGDRFKPANANGCLFVKFDSDNSKNLSGWNAEVSCCTPSLENGVTDGIDLPVADNAGAFIFPAMDHSCIRDGSLEMFTEFESTGSSCYTKGLTYEYQSFYAFQANENGGFVELEIEAVDSVANMEMLVFGPVELEDGMYVGGVINDCTFGTEPLPLFFNAGSGQTYILAVATELEGEVKVNTKDGTVGLGVSLPIEMTYYGLSQKGNEVTISWTTSQEVNNDGFEVFRSSNGRDFDQVGWVDGHENTTSINNYSFSDLPVNSGVYYYYIKQIDLDGNSSKFKILETKINLTNSIFYTFPNPSSGGSFSLFVDSKYTDKKMEIYIYNQLGAIIYLHDITSTHTIEIPSLGSGLYVIKVFTPYDVLTLQHIVN